MLLGLLGKSWCRWCWHYRETRLHGQLCFSCARGIDQRTLYIRPLRWRPGVRAVRGCAHRASLVAPAKSCLLQAIRRKTHAQNECLVYIFGDFNFDAADDKAYNLDTGTYSSGDYRLGRLWNESFPEMTEHFQPEYTRAGGTPNGTVCSRLDRVYSNHFAWVFFDMVVMVSTVGSVLKTTWNLSDHILVSDRLRLRQYCTRIPPYTTLGCSASLLPESSGKKPE